MDTLRLIILLIGLVVIAGVYLRYREPKQPADAPTVDVKASWRDKLKALLAARKAPVGEQDHRIGSHISLEDVDSMGMIKVHSGKVTEGELAEGVHIEWDSMTPVATQDELLIVFNIVAHPEQDRKSVV